MNSKWQVWDFFSSFPAGGWSALQGRAVLLGFDPLSLRLLKEHLLQGVAPRPLHISGADVKPDWVEDQFRSLGLFGNSDCWIIHAPDEAPAVARELLLQDDLLLEGRILAFAAHGETPFIKKLLKKTDTSLVQIEAPRFWETAKLLDFLVSYHQLPLKNEAKQYLLQAVENEFMDLFDACRLIKLNYPEAKEVSRLQVEGLVGVERLDQFALATDMGKKSWRSFFDRLLSVEGDPERLRLVFGFLQGHLLKLADPSYLKDKARLSQYDKEIQGLGKIWRPNEVKETLRRLSDWEFMARTRDPMLVTRLRQARLKVLRGENSPS
jgi:DNA polymerase III delta subunit